MKKIYISAILILSTTWLWGQSCDLQKNHIEISNLCPEIATTLQQGNAVVVARDAITFKPGFTLTPSQLNNHTFTAKIDHNQVVQGANYSTTSSGSTGLPEFSGYAPVPMGGAVDVSPSGAATYQIPIQVSPGSNGMQPSLSVVYSSQSGNGMLGWGWNLAGISAITRTSKNPYYDNTVQPVNLDATDVFALDGLRLIKHTDGYYYPSNNPYTQIEFVGSQKFKLTTQDGVVMEFGYTDISPNSQFKGVGSSVPYSYALSRITDTNGNYIDYLYANDPSTGEYRISEIKYTGNSVSGKTPYNSVKFYYDLRNDPNLFYIKGSKVSQTTLLTSIKVYCEGSLSKDYQFSYMYNDNSLYSKLRMVTLVADGVRHAPITINWGETTVYSADITNAGLGTLYDSQLFFGDVNGDGVVDILKFYPSQTQNSLGVLFGNSDEYSNLLLPFSSVNQSATQKVTITVKIKDIQVVDTDRKGRGDVIVHYTKDIKREYFERLKNAVPGEVYFSSYDLVDKYTYNQNSFGSPVNISNIVICEDQQTFDCATRYKYTHYFVDLDNDGFPNHIKLNSFNSLIESITNISIPPALGTGAIKFIDFNGDGRVDLLLLKSNGYGSIWTVQENTLVQILGETYITMNDHFFFTGDFNGDGRTDYIGKNGINWFMMYSDGIGFVEGELPENIPFEIIPGQEDAPKNIPSDFEEMQLNLLPAAGITIDDINYDGKSDILYIKDEYLYAAINNGSYFKIVQVKRIYDDNYPLPESGYYSPVIYSINLDGELRKQFIYACKRYSHTYNLQPIKKITFNFDLDQGSYVSNINDGLNNTSYFYYQQYSNYYCVNATYPLYPLRGPMKLVNNLKVKNGAILLSDISYTYNDASMHMQGLGFLGFKSVISEDYVTGNRNETSYEYTIAGANGIFSPWPNQIKIYKNGIPISTTTNTMSFLEGDISRKFYMPIVVYNESINHLTGVVTTTNNTYDAIKGRLKKQEISVPNWTKIADYTYQFIRSKNSRLLSITTTAIHGSDTHNHTLSYEYNNSAFPNRVTKKTEQGISTSFTEFDSYGNITRVEMGERVNTSIFDIYGRFVETSTDFGGKTTKVKYNSPNGAVVFQESPTGLVTSYTYSKGSESVVTTIILPDGNIRTKKLEWAEGKTGYVTTESVTNGNTVKEKYNLWGQKVEQTYLGFLGSTRAKLFTYYTDGSLHTESHPGITNPTTYTYLLDGRTKSVTDITGNTVSFSYRNLTVTKNNPLVGKEVTTYDAAGNVISVNTDIGGLVEYTYFASGKVKDITTNNVTTSMTYDDRGNQLTLDDESAGVTSYEYNNFNELVKQTDNKGVVTTISYNADGTISSKSVGSNTLVSYTYFSDQARKGLLKNSTREGVTEEYDYDDLGRPIKLTVSGAQKSFVTLHEYNSIGRLEYTTYPTGLKVKYLYDDVGNLTQIINTSSNVTIWAGQKNEKELWSQFSMQNGSLTTKYEYDESTLQLLSIKTGNSSNPTGIQNLGFVYNDKRQLWKRTEGSLTEEFTYDTKNRLTISQVQGKLPFVVNYSDNGNITGTSQSGEYIYDPNSKPYAVNEVMDPAWQSLGFNTDISYTSDNRIQTISNGTYTDVFAYGPSGQRFKVDHLEGATLQKSKIYVGNSEFTLDANGNITESHTFISAPTGICAVYSKVGSSPASINYVHTDYLGSWLTMTNEAGNEVARQSFDAWGRPRNPNTWDLLAVDLNIPTQALAIQPTAFFDRGYTGHEHMRGFGLINMNGRVYDPYLQRFLSPDPYVQEPGNAQNYNRYSYCVNNPLMYTDPSGENFLLIIGAYYAITHALTSGVETSNNGGNFWAGFGSSLAISTFSMTLGYGTGSLVSQFLPQTAIMFATESSAFVYGALGGAISGGLSGGVTSMLFGGSFKSGFIRGAIGGAIMGGLNGIVQYHNLREVFARSYKGDVSGEEANKPLEKSVETLKEHSKSYFSKYEFSDKANLVYDNARVINEGPKIMAYTDPIIKVNGLYDIVFGDKAFANAYVLFLSMGHEYVHLAHLVLSYDLKINMRGNTLNVTEYAAYKWESNVTAIKHPEFSKSIMDFFYSEYEFPKGYSGYINAKYTKFSSWGLPSTVPNSVLGW